MDLIWDESVEKNLSQGSGRNTVFRYMRNINESCQELEKREWK